MEQLKEIIKTGHENAIPIGHLAIILRTNEREIRRQIEDLRRDGYLICNEQDSAGYYYAETVNDVKRQYDQMYSRAISILTAAKPFRKYLRKAGVPLK